MPSCTFFGHHDAPQTLKPQLQNILTDLITHEGVDTFYVGHQGAFDAMAYAVLRSLSQSYPHIVISVVLAYFPTRPLPYPPHATFLPDGIETVPRRFAILWRNKWMLNRADYVIVYAVHPGNARNAADLARSQNKTVISLI